MKPNKEPSQQQLHLLVRGLVQGVGFRPFLHRLAKTYSITGWVRNTGEGLEGELAGSGADLSAFLRELSTSPPPMAEIERIEAVPCSAPPKTDFQILTSEETPFSTLISADTALCPDCRRELFTPSDRRYRYPFINCTNCGPRYTIIKDLPYDRCRTAMENFSMCPSCQKEFDDINDRRYHAQPDCCGVCGPQVYYLPANPDSFPSSAKTSSDSSPFDLAQKTLAKGGILAVRGIGGIHLACDARNISAVERLRTKKHRTHKPFALMCRSLDTARQLCHISKQEEALLRGSRRPIVLLSKKKPFPCNPACGTSPRVGLMLPYTPIHELLMDGMFGGPDLVIMTSANRPGCPVLTENEEAVSILSDIADGFLLHDRPIVNRCDDSLVTLWEDHPYFFRRSRGYAPAPLLSKEDVTGIFALGAEQKASFALGRGRHIFLSPHIGDLKNTETFEHYQTALQTYQRLFNLKPAAYVCDSHPDYLSSTEARIAADRDNVPLFTVQHHWAHMISCMTDNQLSGPVFGIIWDGTGLAPDHSVWGGEWLSGDAASYERHGSIRPIRLIGGDRAAKEIGRIGVALLEDADLPSQNFLPYSPAQIQQFQKLMGTSFTVNASSIGRLFDGVCSLLCQKTKVEYEGEGAVLLESLSPCEEPDFSSGADLAPFLCETLPFPPDNQIDAISYSRHYYEEDGVRIWDTRHIIREICEDLQNTTPGRDKKIVFRFLVTLCCVAKDQTLSLNRSKLPVVLSGGVFQNRFLLSGVTQLLRGSGFEVYSHRRTAPNDEGLCLGQLTIAKAALSRRSFHEK